MRDRDVTIGKHYATRITGQVCEVIVVGVFYRWVGMVGFAGKDPRNNLRIRRAYFEVRRPGATGIMIRTARALRRLDAPKRIVRGAEHALSHGRVASYGGKKHAKPRLKKGRN